MGVIKEGLNLPADKHRRVEIPDCGRRQLPRFCREMGYKVGVEIGVQRGAFTRRFCREDLNMYGVDPWLAYGDYTVGGLSSYQKHQDQIYEEAKANLAEFPNCILIRKTSMQALEDFQDESIDFVYIDGHHGFKYVTEDIFEWSKKVKKGGMISGHDYAYSEPLSYERDAYILQVKYVVDAYTQAFKIPKWYVLGARNKTFENEKRDQYRSWLFFKR